MPIPVSRPPKASPVNPWGDDLLNRKDLADNLTNLVKDLEDPSLSICVDGAWGTGKTFFLERWQYHLEKLGFPSPIYFNAWEDDFIENPLISILGQLNSHFKQRNIEVRGLLEASTSYARLAAYDLAIVGKGLLKKNTGVDFGELTKDPKEAWGSTNPIRAYLALDQERKVLIGELNRMSRQALESANNGEEPRPIVFIIDELDRCRPTFAIELLERVKHIFNQVPGIIFVFGLNRAELTKSVKSVYGDIDADIYLRRFFDHRFTLPAPSIEEYSKSLFEKLRINELLERIPYDLTRLSGNTFRQEMNEIWQAFGLSLRDIEQTASLINTVVRVMAEDQSRFMAAWQVGAISTLRLKFPELYDGFISGKTHACAVVNEIEPLFTDRANDANALAFTEAYLYVIESRDYERKRNSMNAFTEMYEHGKDFNAEHRRYFSNRVNAAAEKGNGSNDWAAPGVLAGVDRWLRLMDHGLGFDRPQTIAGLIDLQHDPRSNSSRARFSLSLRSTTISRYKSATRLEEQRRAYETDGPIKQTASARPTERNEL